MPRSTTSTTSTLIVGLVLLAGAVFLSLGAGCAESGGAEVERREVAPRHVETAPVTPATATSTLRFAGSVRPVERAVLAFAVGGRLAARPVEVGDRVGAGARLATLDREETSHAAAAAEAAHAEAAAVAAQRRRDLDRVRGLAEKKAATAEELEQAEAASQAAAAAVERAAARRGEARRQAGETALTAPWAGTVTEVWAEPGEYLSKGAPVVALSGDGEMEVEIRVPESLLPDLDAGQAVAVVLPFGGGRVAGTVTSVGRAAAGAGRLFPVRVALPTRGDLVPGTTAEVLVEREPKGALSLPLTAVLNPGGERPQVFVVRDGRAHAVPVEVATLSGARVTVEADLSPGDRVVVAGVSRLIDGDAVTEAATAVDEVER